jgi:gentisate 1,2-dioxygenase
VRIACLGGGPGGLLAALLAKRSDPGREVTVYERNRAGDTFGFGVVFSDATLDGIHAADPVLRSALTTHGVHWDPIEVSDTPMAWLDGLDIPLVAETDQGFFEFGPDQVRNRETPDRSASERLWGQPGLTPVALAGARPASPLMAYRWAHTDAALTAQLELEAEDAEGVLEPGHAAVRYTNPTSGGDALTTMRTEVS